MLRNISKIHSVSLRQRDLIISESFSISLRRSTQFARVFVLTTSLFRNPSFASVKLPFATTISRFVLLSYNNLWRNEAHPLVFRIFSSPRGVLAHSRLADSLSTLLFLLSYLSDSLANHSRYPLTSTIYSALLFLLSTSQTSPGRNELIRTWRFRGVSFTVPQVPRLSSTIRWRFTIPVPVTSVRTVWQAVTCNSCSCRFSLLSMQDMLESLYSK